MARVSRVRAPNKGSSDPIGYALTRARAMYRGEGGGGKQGGGMGAMPLIPLYLGPIYPLIYPLNTLYIGDRGYACNT